MPLNTRLIRCYSQRDKDSAGEDHSLDTIIKTITSVVHETGLGVFLLDFCEETGKDDLNGKRIFEQDFIKTPDGTFLVVFDKNKAAFTVGRFYLGDYHASDLEVVGNSVENPELIDFNINLNDKG